MKPTVHHSVMTTTAIIAQVGSCNQAICSTPNAPSREFTSPSCGLYIQIQNWAATVEASRNGMKNESRHSHCPGSPWWTSRARTSATITSGTVESTVNHSVLSSERHMIGSFSAST